MCMKTFMSTATIQVAYKRDNLSICQGTSNRLQNVIYIQNIWADFDSSIEGSPIGAHPGGLFNQFYFSCRSQKPVKSSRLDE